MPPIKVRKVEENQVHALTVTANKIGKVGQVKWGASFQWLISHFIPKKYEKIKILSYFSGIKSEISQLSFGSSMETSTMGNTHPTLEA